MEPAFGQNPDLPLVTYENQLVQEKVEMEFVHLPHDRHELAEPHITLFGGGSVEQPLVVNSVEFGEAGRVAVHDAEAI